VVKITVNDPGDRSYPFRRELFEDPCVVYHGSWSTWSPQIEATGFHQGDFPFEWKCVATVCNRTRAIGRGSFLSAFVDKQRNLFFAANFWFARAYATDGGGEIVRKAIEEAEAFERICSVPAERDELLKYLTASSQQAAISILTDDKALSRLRTDVKEAKNALMSLTQGGHPVVYAVAVKPDWFEDWARYISYWEMGIRIDLQCRHDVAPERILAKVNYPNNTDREFLPTWCRTWDDAAAFASGDRPEEEDPVE
jgi:hypothetical protein